MNGWDKLGIFYVSDGNNQLENLFNVTNIQSAALLLFPIWTAMTAMSNTSKKPLLSESNVHPYLL